MTARQKIWICIGIVFLLLAAIGASVLLSAAEEQTERGASFVQDDRYNTEEADTYAFGYTCAKGAMRL